jgi:hypothetical protein
MVLLTIIGGGVGSVAQSPSQPLQVKPVCPTDPSCTFVDIRTRNWCETRLTNCMIWPWAWDYSMELPIYKFNCNGVDTICCDPPYWDNDCCGVSGPPQPCQW